MKCFIKYMGFVLIFFFHSCNSGSPNDFSSIVKKWNGRTITMTSQMENVFQKIVQSGVNTSEGYKILNYIDSTGCFICKLKLCEWKLLIDSLKNVPILFSFNPNSVVNIETLLRKSRFDYPVCVDKQDSLNKLNHFPSDSRFQTFLLDKNNRVVAIGNPVQNPKVKDLYMRIINGENKLASSSLDPQTAVSFRVTSLDFGTFSWKKNQKRVFQLKNEGNKPLVISAVTTSCGCTQVDYEKQPIHCGSETNLIVNYKADHPEHFNKTIVVYCNAKESPIQLTIVGNAH